MSPSFKSLLPQRGGEAAVATKPARKETKPAAPVKKQNALVRYFRETQSEIKKVVWPSRDELRNLTLVVCVVTIVAAIFLGAIDTIFEFLILSIR